MWAEYARLATEEGWTQQRIAEAKGVSRQSVVNRIKYAALADEVKSLVSDGFLTEGHLEPISAICPTSDMSSWLTPAQITLELAQFIKYQAGKNGGKSVKATREDAKRWKEFITYAETTYNALPTETQLYDKAVNGQATFKTYSPQAEFVQALTDKKARSLAGVKEARALCSTFSR
ncbi:MAG: hypothetical protein AAF267_23025 [Deinococcota bacterium]